MRLTMIKERGLENIDITGPDHGVEVKVRQDGKVLWVDVDGRNVLRVCRIPSLVIDNPSILAVGTATAVWCARHEDHHLPDSPACELADRKAQKVHE